VQRRWRALLLLVLLVGIVGSVVLTTIAGARRSSSAFDRFRQETLASDLDVAFDGPPAAGLEAAAEAVRALPKVVALERLDYPFIVPAGSGFYPYLDFLAAVNVDDSDATEINRPRLLEGRAPDPAHADEIAIVETYARESGLRVGDRAEFESFAPAQLEPLFTTGDAGPPAGPRFTFVVTGVLDAPTFLSESSGDFTPRVFLSPAFRAAHGDEVATYSGGFSVRLRGGAADADEVTETLRRMFADSTTLEVTPSSEVDRKIESGIDVIVTALALCALVAVVAGAVAIAQALARHFGSQVASERALAARGMTRLERVASQVLTTVPVAVLGAAVAVGGSVLASPLTPVGIARRAEPDPGISVDRAVVLLGFVGVVIATLALAVLAAQAVDRRARLADDGAQARPSRLMVALRRTSLAPQATTGVGMAVEPRGGTAWAVRSALLGVVFGVAGVIAVLVFVASVDGLVASPEHYGSPFDAAVSGFSGDLMQEGGAALLDDPRASGVALGLGGLGRVGGVEVNTYAVESLKGDIALPLLTGHQPSGGAEVVLGTSTLEHAGVTVGDEVDIEGARRTLRATVVGTAVFPVVDERSAPGRGVLLGREDFERISAPDEVNADVLIRWADGVDVDTANHDLAEATGTEVFAPRLPSDVNNLRDVKELPRLLAAFLALLAALAVVHALLSTVRMRRHELAVLRSLGFESRQLGSTLVWQASTIGLIGLTIGVPLGVIAGRFVWEAVTGGIGVVDAPVAPAVPILVVLIAALVVLNIAATVPSRRARKIAAAAVLSAGG
jgi:hypothetical protein